MAPISLVVFDLDGTVADTFEDIASSANHALAVLGRPAQDPARIRTYVGDGVGRLVERLLPGEGTEPRAACAAAFRAHYGANLVVRSRLYPGAGAALSRIARRRTVALASNKPEAWCGEVLERLGVRDLFSAIVGGDTLPVRKPDPLPLTSLLARFGTAATAALMVGDTETDERTARAAGVRFAGVTTGIAAGATLAAAGATVVLDGIPELADWLEGR
ncbi:MAG: HAD hydrolase-like protein [Planctomycetes bacterium]|nr:HAD hydrolase-like protein [Planctomycetota bacterium]